ncbi:MAG: DUF881 domain-containing protein [Clostridia bacterium]|nr:DUF881 domain-containing protein [Clostridia bacterium]
MSKRKIAVILTIMCLIIVSAILIQIRTIESINSPVLKIIANDNLRVEVLKWKDRYDKTTTNLEKIERKLEKVRQKATKNDESFKSKEQTIKKYNTILGLTDVNGEGVTINISTKQLDESTKDYLDNIINELKNAGAESISINNQRLIWDSVIFCDGNVIKVNLEKIESPFIIKAIGDTRLLYGALVRPGGYIELLNSNGIKAEVEKSTNIQIQKYNGLINLEHLKSIT